ncbi:MAG: glycosyl hydrolase family 5 [Rhodospirillaceae bacterium]|nr:glycosyl hydrolase family 5 [Rhodospirillaceae bacterium]
MPVYFKNIIATVLLVSAICPQVAAEPYGSAVLQALDKVTARVSTFEAPVGDSVRFGSLHIIARACDKRPPEETPESAAFLDISEIKLGESTEGVYRGWMFASSPALAAMEHPVYDVWVVDCKRPFKTHSSSSAETSP